jgi:hypothetical protein
MRMAEVVEDRQRVTPGLTSRVGGSGSEVRVTDVGEGAGLEEAVAEVVEDIEGVPVAGEGAAVVAELVVGVAHAVPCDCLAGAVSDLLVQGQGLPAVDERVVEVAESGLVPSYRVERSRPAVVVVAPGIEVKSSLGVLPGFDVVVLRPEQPAEIVVRTSLTDAVLELFVQLEGFPEVGVRVFRLIQVEVRASEIAMCVRLSGPVSQPPGRLEGCMAGRPPDPPLAPSVEEVGQGPGELPGVGVHSDAIGLVDCGQQGGVFVGEPGHCLFVVGEFVDNDAGLGLW